MVAKDVVESNPKQTKVLEALIESILRRIELLSPSANARQHHFHHFQKVALPLTPIAPPEDSYEEPPSYIDAIKAKQVAPPAPSSPQTEEIGHFRQLHRAMSSIRESISSYWQYDPNTQLCVIMSKGIRCSLTGDRGPLPESIDGIDSELDIKYRFTPDGEYDLLYGNTFQSQVPFYFTEFAPFLFESIRLRYGITCEDFVQMIASEEEESSLTPMEAEGKSSASFFVSSNKRLIVKSLTDQEFEFFRMILMDYYHVCCILLGWWYSFTSD